MLLTTVCLWALNFVASKYVITHGISPLAYAAPRYAIAGVIFVALTLALERSLRVARRDAGIFALCAAVLLVNQLGFIYALHFTTATTVALCFGTLPIFTGLIATSVGMERLTRRVIGAGLVSFAGVVLVAVGSGGTLSTNLKGDGLALLGAATWAVYTVTIAPQMTRYSPLRISAWIIPFAAVLLLASGSVQIARENYPSAPSVWWIFAFAVIGPLVVTNVLWFTAVDRVGPSRSALFANLQFFLAALFGVVLLHEGLSLVQCAGGVAIAGGIVLSRGGAAPVVRIRRRLPAEVPPVSE
jgi:drug/metabolite transporter (DMT)-like permease